MKIRGKRAYLLVFVCLLGAVNNSFAQSSASAYQRIEIHIRPSIEIALLKAQAAKFELSQKGKSKATDTAVKEQSFRIRSNKKLMINVGAAKVQPAISVEKTLSMRITADGHSEKDCRSVSTVTRRVLKQKRRGEQLFAVNYEMKTNRPYPAGDYTVGVLYTATEP